MKFIYTLLLMLTVSTFAMGASATISWKLYSDPTELSAITLEQSCDNRVVWTELTAAIPPTDTSFTVTGLAVGDFCDWRMFAVFLSGSRSGPSNTVGKLITAGPVEQVTVDP